MKTPINYKLWMLKIAVILLSYPMLNLLNPAKVNSSLNRDTLHTTIEPLRWETFINGTLQESITQYVNDQIGGFPFFVKLHNQLEYSIFGKVHSGKIIAGKENYLFEQSYVDAYFGDDLKSTEEIARFAANLKELQDSLAARNKLLVYAMATGKASFYPEYLPLRNKLDSTNYHYFLKEFRKNGVNHIDYQPYFKHLKSTYGKLLFPKFGIHWSHFSNVFVADTLVKYVEHSTDWRLPHIRITKMNYSKKPRYFDNDIAGAMNLFVEPNAGQLAYPDFEWQADSTFDAKKILIIGDSYAWDLVNNIRIGTECFSDLEFWYYNATVHKPIQPDSVLKYNLPLLVRHRDLYQTLNEYDVFVILSNEPNLMMDGWNFPKWALASIKDPGYNPPFSGDEPLLENCYNKESWRRDLETLAAERGVSFQEMVEIYLHDKNFKFSQK